MGIIKFFKRVRNNYVIKQVQEADIPEFGDSEVVRHHYIFSGKVQHVGFRLEVEQLAKRLELTGWVKNCNNVDVEMEIQGQRDRIEFLVEFMSSLKRIKIHNLKMDEEPVAKMEQMFMIL